MNSSSARRNFVLSATLSNYVALAVRIACMLVLTRLLFQHLSADAYGFWALLWAIFGYSVLLDFGLGVATQKLTSEVMVHQNWPRFNRHLSTIVTLYSILAIVLGVAIALGGKHFVTLFRIEDHAQMDDFQMALVYFGLGTALSFPSGIFVEVLRGAHCIRIRNLIQIARELANTALMSWVLLDEPGMTTLALIAVGTQLAANLAMALASRVALPGLRISLCWPTRSELRDLLSFSLFAYIIMLTNLMILRSDQIVLSALGTVAMAGLFNIGAKLADLFRQLATQFHDVLGPMAARLHAAGDQAALAEVTLTSSRWIAIIATALVLPLLLETDRLLLLWLDLANDEAVLCARLLVISMWILVVLRNTGVQVLLMCGKQRALAGIALLEAIANVSLSIGLLPYYGMTGVALGTLIPNLLCALLLSVPMTCRFAGVSSLAFYRHSLVLPVLIMAICIVTGVAVRSAFPTAQIGPMLLSCLCMGLIYVVLGWRLLLTAGERALVLGQVSSRLLRTRYT